MENEKSFYCLGIDQARRELEEAIPASRKITGEWIPETTDGEIPEIMGLKLSSLTIDRQYQRTLSASQLTSYGDFDFSLLNPITVVIRPDNTNSVVDGQHSCVFVYCATGDINFEVDCRVFDMRHLSMEECLKFEAKLYKTLNKNRKPTGDFESLKAGVILEEKEALLFDRYLRSMGLRAENLGCQLNTSRKFRPQKASSKNSIGDVAPKIGQFIKCFRRYNPMFREEMSSAINIVKTQTKGDIEDRMILVTTAIVVFLECGQMKDQGKISNSSNHLTYNHFSEWLQNNMNNLTWVKSGDDLGYRCMHIIMNTYEDYVKSLPAELRPRRTLTKADLNYNGFFHPDEKPSKVAWVKLYEEGKVVTKYTNPLKGLK